LQKVVAKATKLTKRQEQLSLFTLLQKYEELFDSTLGQLNTESVNIELCDNEKTVSSRYYLVPNGNKEMLNK
jgi:hypothetical protein